MGFNGQKYSTKVVQSLCPLVIGFGMVASSEAKFQVNGFLCAIGSVTILVMMSLLTKDQLSVSGAKEKPHWAQVQLWSCSIAAAMQATTWGCGSGPTQVLAAFNDEKLGLAFIQLVVINGAMYYGEQVMQFKAIERYATL